MAPNAELWTRLLLAVIFGGALAFFLYRARRLYRLMMLGRADPERTGLFARRLRDELIIYLGQRKLLKTPYLLRGLGHAFIFWGFLVITYGTADLLVAGVLGLRLPGAESAPFVWMVDVFAVLVLASVIVALARRLFFAPPRMIVRADGYIVLVLIGVIMVTLFLFESAAVAGKLVAEGQTPPPAGQLLAPLFAGPLAQPVFTGAWWLHLLTVSAFLTYLPESKHLHIVTTLPNVFFRSPRPRGSLRLIEKIEEQEVFGAQSLRDFSWKQHLDGYTCTECGRCSDQCPATSTGKALDPKMIVLKVKEQLLHEGDALLRDSTSRGRPPTPDPVDPQELWDCTTCMACVEACPVTIEHVDKIVDMRRYLALMESAAPPEAQNALRNIERAGNPWGQSPDTRGDWARDAGVPTLAERPDAEYVYFVGCAASFDQRNQKVARALAQILRAAGVSFAILGAEETCNGDPARRIGNEYLWQLQAQQNVDTFKRYGVRKVITSCPHCFNTIRNEYPQLGGSYEVVHAVTLLRELMEQGRLRLANDGSRKIAYHDPCYLGRHNGIYDQPRDVLRGTPGTELVEIAPHCRERGFCCGAGGGRMWMEERHGERINHRRMSHVLGLDQRPDGVASACPFCLIMLEEAAGAKGVREQIEPVDVLELVARRLDPAARSSTEPPTET
jgi:Fe-S oxidoreductase